MKKKIGLLLSGLLITAALIGGIAWLLRGTDIAVLNPQGWVAEQQRDLFLFTTSLSLLIVVPVFSLALFIAWKYREGNTKAKYMPEWDKNKWIEAVWWGIPCAIILVLAVVTWQTSHSLDPYKKLDSSVKPIEVQVVALQWKWLFIYPEHDIASVNLVEFPVNTPVNFSITADAPMNSFWIPSLGGQVYAMSGMSTKLHLIADKPGDYRGSSANISGEGFASMVFTARAVSNEEFKDWTDQAKAAQTLDMESYEALARPSEVTEPAQYALRDKDLYGKIVMKYMDPGHAAQQPSHIPDNTTHEQENHSHEDGHGGHH